MRVVFDAGEDADVGVLQQAHSQIVHIEQHAVRDKDAAAVAVGHGIGIGFPSKAIGMIELL